MAIPYAIIGGLTHFHAGHSTKAQRVWTMGWLAFGTVWGHFVPGLNSSFAGPRSPWRVKSLLGRTAMSIYVGAFYSAFAFGGLVVVVQMLVAYGSCNSLT